MKKLDVFIIITQTAMLVYLFKKMRARRTYLNSLQVNKGKYSLRDRKILTSGDFFPTSKKAFLKRLRQLGAQVQQQLDAETEILICGKYPDYGLLEEARNSGIKIIFIDKVSDLYSRPESEASEEASKSVLPPSVPLGV